MPKTRSAEATKKQRSNKKQPKTKNTPQNQPASFGHNSASLSSTASSRRITKEQKIVRPAVPGAMKIFMGSLKILKQHWKLFVLIGLTYGILNIILVRGLAGNSNLSDIKSTLHQSFKGNAGQLWTSLTLFVYLLGSSGNNSNASAGLYQTVLVVIVSLATIWSLRQIYNKINVSLRDGFYRGMYPFIPFILILLVIGLQLIPLLIGGLLYSTVISNGIAIHFADKALWGGVFIILAALSIYMLCSSLFALYIVTLPDMTPMKALRSARQLVRSRRLIILRKILFLPLVLIIAAFVIMLPMILFLTPVAAWVIFILTMFGLIIVHSYMYALYRELLA